MDRLILEQLRRTGDGCGLARFTSGVYRCVLCAYTPQSRFPAWVAKIADRRESIVRLRAEQDALRHLSPWSGRFRIPEVLAWEDRGETAVLVQSGVAGTPLDLELPLDAKEARMDRAFSAPVRWLEDFSATVPMPAPAAARDVAAAYGEAIRAEAPVLGPPAVRLADFLAAGYNNFTAAGAIKHGDFFAYNVLIQKDTIAACDWDKFGAGVPNEDLFSLVGNAGYSWRGSVCTLLQKYSRVFFSDWPAAQWLRRRAVRQSSPEEDRLCFYGFVARQVSQEKGLSRVQARELLEALDECGFPGPWSDAGRALLKLV